MAQQNNNKAITLKTITDAASGRALYIWGAGNQGRGLCQAFIRQGIKPFGFIDTSSEMQKLEPLGVQVFSPESVLQSKAISKKPFIIIASFFFETEIAQLCQNAGFVKFTDFIPYTAIKPFDYAVDISGICNLRCMSCPRAQRADERSEEGFMAYDTFTMVLDKIIAEDPFAGSIQLYQWGEPLLNDHVAKMISYANSRGIQCAVSSNLNNSRNLEAAVKAQPGWFRISVSGIGSHYEKTHTGGSWEKFRSNFFLLSQLRQQYNPNMKTEVYYHLYKHNQGEDLQTIATMCKKAGFEFHPVFAYVISLDDVLAHLEGKALPKEALEVSAMLALSLEEGMALAKAEKEKECQTLRCIHVNWDLSVSGCMMFYYAKNNRTTDNFLTTSLADIIEKRNANPLCGRCKKQALHRYCSVYSTKKPTVSFEL